MDSTAKGDVSNKVSKVENSSVSQMLFRDQMTDNGKAEYTITNILQNSTASLSMSLVIVDSLSVSLVIVESLSMSLVIVAEIVDSLGMSLVIVDIISAVYTIKPEE